MPLETMGKACRACLSNLLQMFCMSCGKMNPDEAAFCMKCGAKYPTQDKNATSASPTPAASPTAAPSWLAPVPASARAASPSSLPAGSHPAPLVAEQEVWAGAVTFKGMLTWGWVAVLCVPLPVIVGAYSMRIHFEPQQLWMLSLVTLLPVVAFGIRWWMRRSTAYRVTTERISVLRGILSRESVDLQLMRVADVQFYQLLLGRFLNVGDIRVLSSDKAVPDMVIPGVESPAEFKEMLWNLVRERRRNLVAMEQLNPSAADGPPLF